MVFLDKDRTMDNVQKHNTCINVPSSQTFRSESELLVLELQMFKIVIVVVGGGGGGGSNSSSNSKTAIINVFFGRRT
jgi:hypothetical protein